MNEQLIWQAKVLAFLHDPAEKALILMRGKSHEAGTVAAMKELLGEDLATVSQTPGALREIIKKADRWAAAADRPSLPMNIGGQVSFAVDPQIIHPLTGQNFRLRELAGDVHTEAIEAVSLDHFRRFLFRDDSRAIDWKKTFLSLWRFGPASPAPGLGVLWNMLPADTRSPDHTIWEHLKLASGFAGAFAADSEGPALLLMSFGPVQGFIAQARSISDLWAGSHLLSRISWEALQVLCERYGPDAVLFPDLHGVPLADLWLYRTIGPDFWPQELDCSWLRSEDDTNPLFAAALPNRFVALVPAGEAEKLAREITEKIRFWSKRQAFLSLVEMIEVIKGKNQGEILREAVDRGMQGDEMQEILEAKGLGSLHFPLKQIERQIHEFPEVNWAVIPWRLAGEGNLDDHRLKELLMRLGASNAYLPEKFDALVRGEINIEGHPFFTPNPGVGYPGLYEALERLHGAAKSVRRFGGEPERGYRCTLCGEREWLTDDENLLNMPPGERKKGSLWALLSDKKPALAKTGEHLCGVCALKRTWPRLFVKEIEKTVPELGRLDRFVLSTHTMAMASSLWGWLDRRTVQTEKNPEEATQSLKAEGELRIIVAKRPDLKPVALPRRLYRRLRLEKADIDFIKRIPALLDETDLEQDSNEISDRVEKFLGVKPETYYALVILDGDRMGAWLAGEEGRLNMKYRFHQTTLEALNRTGKFADYLESERPASPARHQAISTALNAFALNLARVVVEDLFLGKLIYAGGDDLLAMVAVRDLPGLMWALRCAYSGVLPAGENHEGFWRRISGKNQDLLQLKNGFARLKDGIYRLMGDRATASLGAVITHHQAPLGRVLTVLRRAEKTAKGTERDGFCIVLDKRAGGTLEFSGRWRLDAGLGNADLGLLLDTRDLLAQQVSRRAAYLLAGSLRDVPERKEALEAVLAYQFGRQSRKEPRFGNLPSRLASNAIKRQGESQEAEWPAPNRWLRDLILVAEFLAREGRIEKKGKENLMHPLVEAGREEIRSIAAGHLPEEISGGSQ